jgi:hypothetical protein
MIEMPDIVLGWIFGATFVKQVSHLLLDRHAPNGFADGQVKPGGAYFDQKLGEYLLPYDVVRKSSEPEAALMAFLESTYRAAADFGRWDRARSNVRLATPFDPAP